MHSHKANFPETISTDQLIDITSVPRRTISTWTTAGIIAPTARGHWDTRETLRAIYNYLRTSSAPTSSRAALVKEQTRLKKLQADEIERRVISREEAEGGWTTLSGLIVSMLEGLAGRLAMPVANCDDPSEVRALLKREVTTIRTELANKLDELVAEARGDGS